MSTPTQVSTGTKRRNDMRPEVKEAVQDLLHGVDVNSPHEWLQREYIRLMRREAAYKRNVSQSKNAVKSTVGDSAVKEKKESNSH